MRVGLIPLFGWMPHSAHFAYLAHALKELGHEVDVLTCDGRLPTCYNLEINGKTKKYFRCAICRASTAVVSFQGDYRSHLSDYSNPPTSNSAPMEWIYSSLRTLHRIEGNSMLSDLVERPQALRLSDAAGQTFDRVKRWIAERSPDYVFVFNGRMDISRAAIEALRATNVPFASVERSFAGHGINILPDEDCLGLKAVHRLTNSARDSSLSPARAWAAGQFLHDRLLGQTKTEWRNYTANATEGAWPLDRPGVRILILPSSMNEIEGSTDYRMDWDAPTTGFDAVVTGTHVEPGQVVVRGHPNWATDIGVAQGDKISRYYAEWAAAKGYHYIDAESNVRSADLMRSADLVVVSHSSAAFEAISVGRHVIAVGTAHYSMAGFAHDASSPAKLDAILKKLDLKRGLKVGLEKKRRLLRYINVASFRIPMFADDIKPLDARHCEMFSPRNLDRLRDILEGKPLQLELDDGRGSETEEDSVIARIGSSDWPEETQTLNSKNSGKPWPHYRGHLLFELSRRLR